MRSSNPQSLTPFATVALIPPSFPPLNHRDQQQKQPKEWLDGLFRSIFTGIQAVIDVEGDMALRMLYLVERIGGTPDFWHPLNTATCSKQPPMFECEGAISSSDFA